MTNEELQDKLFGKLGELLDSVEDPNEAAAIAHAYAAVRNANR